MASIALFSSFRISGQRQIKKVTETATIERGLVEPEVEEFPQQWTLSREEPRCNAGCHPGAGFRVRHEARPESPPESIIVTMESSFSSECSRSPERSVKDPVPPPSMVNLLVFHGLFVHLTPGSVSAQEARARRPGEKFNSGCQDRQGRLATV